MHSILSQTFQLSYFLFFNFDFVIKLSIFFLSSFEIALNPYKEQLNHYRLQRTPRVYSSRLSVAVLWHCAYMQRHYRLFRTIYWTAMEHSLYESAIGLQMLVYDSYDWPLPKTALTTGASQLTAIHPIADGIPLYGYFPGESTVVQLFLLGA